MFTQELLTFLFNAIALGFIIIASMDFGTRLVVAYKQVSSISNSPSASTQKPISKLPLAVKQQQLGQLPEEWLLPVQDKGEIVPLTNLALGEQKHLRLLPPGEIINVSNPELEDLLQAVDLDRLKLRQARKIAKVLGIAQKVNGRDQKLAFLVSQIRSKLQQAKAEIVEVVIQELIAC